MAESADWWGSINEQMKKYSGTRNLPTKVADEHDLPSGGPESAGESDQRPKVLSAEYLSNPTPAKSSSSAPPARPQSTAPPVTKPQQQQQPQQQMPPRPLPAAPVAAAPASYFAQPPPPPSNEFSSLSLAEQMELKLKGRSQGASVINSEDLKVPQFEAAADTTPRSPGNSNPWDSYQADDGGW